MLSNKDIRIENGYIIINGKKYPIVQDVSALDERVTALESGQLKVAEVSATMSVITADAKAIGGYRSVSSTAKNLSTFTGFPEGKTIVAESLYAYGENAAILAVINVIDHNTVYLNAANSGDYNVKGVVFYYD